MARIRFDCRRPHVGLDPDAGMARRTSGGDAGRAHGGGDPFFAWSLFCRAARLSDVDTGAGSSAGLGQGRRRPGAWPFLPDAGGVLAMTAASVKPSGILLLLLPVFARVERDWRAPLWVFLGAAGTGILVFGTLAAWGGLGPFITTMQGMMPRYASLGARTVPEISEDVVVWLAPTAGLALAAVLNIPAPKPPRVRVMIGLTLFGLIHLLVQRKGWFYHVYPLGIGLACWGAWSLASLPPWRAAVCLLLMATCACRKLDSAILMMKAAKDRLGCDGASL